MIVNESEYARTISAPLSIRFLETLIQLSGAVRSDLCAKLPNARAQIHYSWSDPAIRVRPWAIALAAGWASLVGRTRQLHCQKVRAKSWASLRRRNDHCRLRNQVAL